MLIKKKIGEIRFCMDYRNLKEATKKHAYPLPRIDSCLDAMSGTRLFSTFDVRACYHQNLHDPESAEKTTYITQEGRFKSSVFVMCQQLFALVISLLNLEVCLVYFDDIVVFFKDLPDHCRRLRLIIDRMQEAQLKLKPSKLRRSQFLGTRRVGKWNFDRPSKD